MNRVRRAFRIHVGPKAGYLKSAVPGFQELQDRLGRVVDAGDQTAKLVPMMQVLRRLPAAARRRPARAASRRISSSFARTPSPIP